MATEYKNKFTPFSSEKMQEITDQIAFTSIDVSALDAEYKGHPLKEQLKSKKKELAFFIKQREAGGEHESVYCVAEIDDSETKVRWVQESDRSVVVVDWEEIGLEGFQLQAGDNEPDESQLPFT